MGLATIAESAASKAYKNREERIWKQDLESSPHGAPWSTSFHASQFPGNPETACGRKLIYGLMNIPNSEPVSEYGRAIMDAGKAIEDEYVTRYEEDGVLLSRPPTYDHQTGFKDSRFWLTGNLDAVIRPEGWNRGHAVEIKSKDNEVIKSMKSGLRSYDEQHYFQLQVYLGFLKTESFNLYKDHSRRQIPFLGNPDEYGLTEPVSSGSILYVSRDRPRYTHEFTFDYDDTIWNQGTTALLEYQKDFVRGILPQRNSSWKWLAEPCKYCPFKRICKADDKAGVGELVKSVAIPTAIGLRPAYDYNIQRKNVLERWSVDDQASTNP